MTEHKTMEMWRNHGSWGYELGEQVLGFQGLAVQEKMEEMMYKWGVVLARKWLINNKRAFLFLDKVKLGEGHGLSAKEKNRIILK